MNILISIDKTYSNKCNIKITKDNCYHSCEECSLNETNSNITSHNCIKCKENYFPFPGYSSNCFNIEEMNDKNISYFFDNERSIFIECYPECQTCNGPNKNNCLSCIDESLLIYNGECLAECPNGTFVNNSHKTCENFSTNSDSLIKDKSDLILKSNLITTDNLKLEIESRTTSDMEINSSISIKESSILNIESKELSTSKSEISTINIENFKSSIELKTTNVESPGTTNSILYIEHHGSEKMLSTFKIMPKIEIFTSKIISSISNIENNESEIQSFISNIATSILKIEPSLPKTEIELSSLKTESTMPMIETTNLKIENTIYKLDSTIMKSDYTDEYTNITIYNSSYNDVPTSNKIEQKYIKKINYTTLSEFKKQILNNTIEFFDSINLYKVINGSDFLALISLSSEMNQEKQINKGISLIDLGNCTNTILEHYNMTQNESFYILNIELKKNKTEKQKENNDNSLNLGTETQIAIFNKSGYKLNLSLCKNDIIIMKNISNVKKINIEFAMSYSEKV